MAAAADNFNVSKWLDSFGLKEYAHSFEDNGYDSYELCSDLMGEDLDVMEIDNVVHRDAIFYQAQLLKNGEEANKEGNYTEPWTQVEPPTQQQQGEGGESSAYSEPWTSIPIPGQQQEDTYTEPWTSIPSPGQQQQGDTYTEPWTGDSTYTEPWTQSAGSSSPRIKPSLKPKPPGLTVPSSTSSAGGKSPKSPRTPKSPSKVAAIKQPRLAEPSSPAVPGDGGAQHGGTQQLTKLQLKLKLRDELVKDHIDLSEESYRNANGAMDEQTVAELAEMYAERFSIESLEVFDAVTALWSHNNNQTGFATPHQQQDTSIQPPQAASKYISPITSKKKYSDKDKKRKKSAENPKLPDNTSQKDTYIQPFDAVHLTSTNQTTIQKAPEPPPKPSKPLPKPDSAVSKTKTMAPKKSPVNSRRPVRSSLTLPAPSSPNLSVSSSSSEEAGSGRGNKRNRLRNMFKKSSAKDKTKLRSSSKRTGGSMEDISESGTTADMKSKRKSLQPTGLPRSVSTFPALLFAEKKDNDDSDSDEATSMKKKLSGSLGSLTTPTDTPIMPRTESGTSSSSDQSKPTTSTSRIKSIRLAPPTAPGPTDNGKSSFEISNVVEVYVAGCDKPLRFTRAKSNEQLDKVVEENGEGEGKETMRKNKGKTLTKPKKQGGFLSRLLKPKSHKDKHESKTTPRPETSLTSESGLTASVSMPNIVAASVHSEYTDILDSDTGDSDTPKTTPPQLPKRQHVTPARVAPPRPSPSPPMSSPHHLLMIKSGSASSSELANSAPRDDIIEISVPKQTSIDSSLSMALQSPMDLDAIGSNNPWSDTHTRHEAGSQYTTSLNSLEKTLTPSSPPPSLTPSSPPQSVTSLSPSHRNTKSQSTGSLVESISRTSSNASQRSRSGSKPPVAPKPALLASTIHRTSSDSKPSTPVHKTLPSSLAMRRTGSDNTPGSAAKTLTPSPLSSPAHQSDSPAHQSAAPPKPVRGKARQSLYSPSRNSNTADKKYQTLDSGGSSPIAQNDEEEERVRQHRPLGYSATMPYKRGQQRPPKPARQRRSVSPSIDTSLEDLLAIANLFHLSSKLRHHGITSANQLRTFTTEQLNELPLKPTELLKLQKHL